MLLWLCLSLSHSMRLDACFLERKHEEIEQPAALAFPHLDPDEQCRSDGRMLIELMSFYVAVALGLRDHLPETRLITRKDKIAYSVHCEETNIVRDGARECSCNCKPADSIAACPSYLVRLKERGILLVEVKRPIDEVALVDVVACFNGQLHQTFRVGPRWNNFDDFVSVPCSAQSNGEVAALTVFDILMGNQDRIADQIEEGDNAQAHNVFLNYKEYKEQAIKNPTHAPPMHLLYIDNGQVSHFLNDLCRPVDKSFKPVRFYSAAPRVQALGVEMMETDPGWVGGLGNLKHNCNFPVQLARVLRTTVDASSFVQLLRQHIGESGLAQMDAVFTDYCKGGCTVACTAGCAASIQSTTDVLYKLAARYEYVRQHIPPACYEVDAHIRQRGIDQQADGDGQKHSTAKAEEGGIAIETDTMKVRSFGRREGVIELLGT